MTVRVRLFAAAAEAAGIDEVELADVSTLAAVLARVQEDFGPDFARVLHQCTVLIDGERCALDVDRTVHEGTQVDIVPPFAGG